MNVDIDAFTTHLDTVVSNTNIFSGIRVLYTPIYRTLIRLGADPRGAIEYDGIQQNMTNLLDRYNIRIFTPSHDVDEIDKFFADAMAPLAENIPDIFIHNGIPRTVIDKALLTQLTTTHGDIIIPLMYFMHVDDIQYIQSYQDFLFHHKDDIAMACNILAAVGQLLHPHPSYSPIELDSVIYTTCMAAATIVDRPILPTSSCYTRGYRGLYKYAKSQVNIVPTHTHPADVIGYMSRVFPNISESRRKAMLSRMRAITGKTFSKTLTNGDIDVICRTLPQDKIQLIECSACKLLELEYKTKPMSVVGGAPDTPLDILKSLLAAIKDDTQKLDAHYNALRQHLVQFAQRINQADVPYSAAPVDYSGLMEKYKELYRANDKLRGENQQLRGENKQLRDEPPLLVQQVAALSQDDALARVLKATYKRPQSRRDPNDSDAMTMMRAIRDIVESLSAPM